MNGRIVEQRARELAHALQNEIKAQASLVAAEELVKQTSRVRAEAEDAYTVATEELVYFAVIG